MSEIAISLKSVSKKYRLFNSPRDRFWEALHPFNKKYHKEFWALKDVSFDVPKGQTVGIVGRNGSGKSTLLQILCSILRPTSGEVTVHGRVSALLELGSGFNPEFTGRQNVLMKGMIMGLPEAEMKKRLPEIEAFADIGDFIDQPMKIYSSGMSVRLAFAAAINVDPDILLIDEALAVGDAKFQQKCYSKFLDFQQAGKTIICVTHDTNAIVRHCDVAFLLEEGALIEIGEPQVITDRYLDFLFTGKVAYPRLSPDLEEEGFMGFNLLCFAGQYYAFLQSLGPIDMARLDDKRLMEYVGNKQCITATSLEELKRAVEKTSRLAGVFSSAGVRDASLQIEEVGFNDFLKEAPNADNCAKRKSYNKNEHRLGDHRAEIIDYFVCLKDCVETSSLRSGEQVSIFLKVRFLKDVKSPIFGFSIKTVDGLAVYGSSTRFKNVPVTSARSGETIVFKFSITLELLPGNFFIDVGVAEKSAISDEPVDVRRGLIHLVVHPKDYAFEGFVDLSATFEEISRRNIQVRT